MKWQAKLTKSELAHVREFGGRTLAGFKRNRLQQARMREERETLSPGGNNEPCWECKQIAQKLGLERRN